MKEGFKLKGGRIRGLKEIIKRLVYGFSDEKGGNTERTRRGEMLHFVFDSRLCVYSKAETLKGTVSPSVCKEKTLL